MWAEGEVYIIAEAGVNHNGSIDLAKKMVIAAAKAGANAVKFQTFNADEIATASIQKANYQKKHTVANESQLNMLKRLELSQHDYIELMNTCKKHNIDFLSTPFDNGSLEFLVKQCGLKVIKISSGDITNAPLLLAAAYTGKLIILSTGMSTLGEIEDALGVLAYGYLQRRASIYDKHDFYTAFCSLEGQKMLRKKVALLHCTTEYPAPYNEVNLTAMDTIKQAFSLNVGYSDHTKGLAVSYAAVARGARIIEKHFTLNRQLEGPDQHASIEPVELKMLVEGIRQIELSLGTGIKIPSVSEYKNMNIARKSIVAKRNIEKNEIFTVENLTVKRSGKGISPFLYWDLLGQRAKKQFVRDERVFF